VTPGVAIEPVGDGRWRVTVTTEAYAPRTTVETSYPPALIEALLAVKGPEYVCDEIARTEDAAYVLRELELSILSFVPASFFAGKRVLDFGSGSGASSLLLSRLLPEARIVGVELRPDLVEVARARAAFEGANVEFHVSPSPDSLPDVGTVDAVVLSAVYEHLLPAERAPLLRGLWSRLNAGGVLFVNQLPYRWSPVEAHTTWLPLLNYLPDRLAHRATRYARRGIRDDAAWDEWLRRGVRGGTLRGIVRTLPGAEALRPRQGWAGLWYDLGDQTRKVAVKKALRGAYRVLDRVAPMEPTLTLAIRRS
jgi:2-polyprenyl-3-methyl-5-hydroxy-6-metoxy-1,4-benzoquinol methylase